MKNKAIINHSNNPIIKEDKFNTDKINNTNKNTMSLHLSNNINLDNIKTIINMMIEMIKEKEEAAIMIKDTITIMISIKHLDTNMVEVVLNTKMKKLRITIVKEEDTKVKVKIETMTIE